MNEPTVENQAEQPGSDRPSSGGELPTPPTFRDSWIGRAYQYLTATGPGRYLTAFAGLGLVALALRLWELGGRTMHYDEAIHLFYSWRLSNLEGFVHSPWMHGPFQIEMVALLLKLLGDNDFAARLIYVLFGTGLVILPYFLRQELGRAGALLTGLMLTVSPSLLYFSRFGRNDIIMAFLTASLFILLWRFSHTPRNRYLYLASGLLALAFAAKETAYIITLIFGVLALLLAIPYSQLRWPWARAESEPGGSSRAQSRRSRPAESPRKSEGLSSIFGGWTQRARTAWRYLWQNPAIGFMVLLATLTLPQGAAGAELARIFSLDLVGLLLGDATATALEQSLGLTLVEAGQVSQGVGGAPPWTEPFVQLPLTGIPLLIPVIVSSLIIAGCMWASWKFVNTLKTQAIAIIPPVAMSLGTSLVLLLSLSATLSVLLASGLLALSVAVFVYLRLPWRHAFLAIFVPFTTTALFYLTFLPELNVDALLDSILPDGIDVASEDNAVPLNYLVAGGVLLATATVSLAVGLLWRGGVWLICAAIFYVIWITLFTTFFTNPAGLFSGIWQGLGYWIAQQDVARGNQPWYYYFIGMSVYEFLPALFGLIGAVWFIKRKDRLGMALSFWAGVNFLAYTVASEKMPWLLVNITLPFIFLAGKMLGDLVDRVSWRDLRHDQQPYLAAGLAAATALTVIGVFSLALTLTDRDGQNYLLAGAVLVVTLGLALVAAWLVRRAGPTHGVPLVGLGVAGLLLGFTIWTAFQATYTFDDSRLEILVYAQGSQDLRESYRELEEAVFGNYTATPASKPIQADYDVWYPFQWYVRHPDKEGQLNFACFKENGGCVDLASETESPALLVAAHNRRVESGEVSGYREDGPRRNLLWFPETYRRPGENRPEEAMSEELGQDLQFFLKSAVSRETWGQALRYLIWRDMESDWFRSEYYTYFRQ